MPDLFISYSSHDRPWADRLYAELRTSYPTLDIFLDHKSIPPGADWRSVLVNTARSTQNLVALWSEKAKQSNEVGPEIEAFEQNAAIAPVVNGLSRRIFYVPLEGDYGPMTAKQSFVKFKDRSLYDSAAQDRGTSHLDTAAIRPVLNECIRWIGDNVARQSPVTLAILAMNASIINLLDPFENIQTLPGHPTLAGVLGGLGLSLPAVKQRYGSSGFEWRPFGTTQTVIDVMEEARREINPSLDAEFRFQWKELDLYGETSKAGRVEPVVQTLVSSGPSVLVVDPISLHNIVIKSLFDTLGDYFNRQEAIVISLAPHESPGLGSLLLSISEKGSPILKPYFNPFVPATGTFAGCGLNLGHKMELTRLVRYGLGLHHLKQKRKEEELMKMS